MMEILAFCFASGEKLPRASLEALAAARRVRDGLGTGSVAALLLGPDVNTHGKTLVEYGADEVVVASHPRLLPYAVDILLAVLQSAVQQRSPSIVILPHNDLGSEIGPRLAYRLKAGIVTDCIDFAIKESAVRWLRPAYGGKALAYVAIRGPVQSVTIRSRAFEPLPPDPTRQGEVKDLEVEIERISSPALVLVEKIQEEIKGVKLDQARIIVSGGRGMEGKDGFSGLYELAEVLGAAVGGSRPAADSGWVGHSQLVGQTGKIVAPDLYIAVGISGAPQHMAGAGPSKTILAINKDEEAPIFKVAQIGVVDQWQNIIPTLIEACKEMRDK